MRFSTTAGLAALSAPLLAMAQTPAGSTPATIFPLGLSFDDQPVFPVGEQLNQSFVDTYSPQVYSVPLYFGKYILALVDLKVPWSAVATTSPETLVPGIGANRTTRLHMLLDNVKQTRDGFVGVFENTTVALAEYEGPHPTLNDEAHEYVMYLFNQPANYVPEHVAPYYDQYVVNGDNRMNFSVTALAEQVGAPIAASYFQCANEDNTV